MQVSVRETESNVSSAASSVTVTSPPPDATAFYTSDGAGAIARYSLTGEYLNTLPFVRDYVFGSHVDVLNRIHCVAVNSFINSSDGGLWTLAPGQNQWTQLMTEKLHTSNLGAGDNSVCSIGELVFLVEGWNNSTDALQTIVRLDTGTGSVTRFATNQGDSGVRYVTAGWDGYLYVIVSNWPANVEVRKIDPDTLERLATALLPAETTCIAVAEDGAIFAAGMVGTPSVAFLRKHSQFGSLLREVALPQPIPPTDIKISRNGMVFVGTAKAFAPPLFRYDSNLIDVTTIGGFADPVRFCLDEPGL